MCLYSGGRCPVVNNLCESSPCPEGMECVADPRETIYSCVCPEGKKGKCSGKTTHLSVCVPFPQPPSTCSEEESNVKMKSMFCWFVCFKGIVNPKIKNT